MLLARLHIRHAEARDADALWDLVRAFPTPTPPTAGAFAATLRLKLSDPSSCLIVADRDNALTGYVAGYSHPTFYADGVTAWVDEILVEEPLRGKGVGRLLMTGFEEWAAHRECVLVSLATGGAAEFYERLGYTSKAGYYKKYLRAPASS